MAYKIRNRMQPIFLPSTIDDYVGPQDPVRVYDAFVDALDFNALGIDLEPQAGADEYYPKDMLKLIIYAYSYGHRSSRKIDRACHHNLSFQWLMGGLTPDYRSIARFRSKYKEQIKQVLKQCVRVCMDLDLIEGNVLFTDGSKFRANASINNTRTKEQCEKTLKKIHEHIEQLVEDSEKIDEQEEPDSMVKLHQKIEEKEQLVQKIQKSLEQLQADDTKKHINSTDGDSVKAKGRQGTHASYNVQINVDEKHGLIVHGEAVSQSHDYNQLSEQVQTAAEVLGKKPDHVCADAGYADVDDLKKIDHKINVIVPSHKQAQEENGRCPVKPFDKQYFVYDQQTDKYVCPEGKRLKFQDIPEPGKRRYQADGSECRACPHFGNPNTGQCTKSPEGRRIIRLVDEQFKERCEANYKRPENQRIYKLRKEKAEHPFGHMKRNLGAGQFMLRGKDKVNAEVSILSTCFNIARMMTILGIPQLINRLNST
jgi:transposase